MELTNRHKLLLGVVGVGVAAVAVDRFLLSDAAPSTALAAMPTHATPSPPVQAPATAPAMDGSADRLQRLAESLPASTPENEAAVAGAFTAPVNWLPEADRVKAVEQQAKSVKGDELTERFRLSSVFTAGSGYATINGVRIEVGTVNDTLGIKLLAIEPPAHRRGGAAIIDYRGQQVRLTTDYGTLKHATPPQK